MRDDTKNGGVAGLLAMEPESVSDQPPTLGLSRLCSATFEQLLAFGATFCGCSNQARANFAFLIMSNFNLSKM